MYLLLSKADDQHLSDNAYSHIYIVVLKELLKYFSLKFQFFSPYPFVFTHFLITNRK